MVVRGALIYESDVHVPTGDQKQGGNFGVRFLRTKRDHSMGGGRVQKWCLFWCGLPKMGVIRCLIMQFQAKTCKFYVKIAAKLSNFLKYMRKIIIKCAKMCNLYVKVNIKVEKRVHWVWRIKKRGHWVILV